MYCFIGNKTSEPLFGTTVIIGKKNIAKVHYTSKNYSHSFNTYYEHKEFKNVNLNIFFVQKQEQYAKHQNNWILLWGFTQLSPVTCFVNFPN